ncbi:PrsW family intramembrane metalloprotease [Actinoplanes sp. M2I2]|uniref:PrsW family intramembrane metalloprotease n=1 Tax=Actinoplanes sp. M2I2 TaxID=1734444 RepID=UPI00202267EE|nr:PrsW family intramembrane metalloprotease [Actinoplanes sp. M2I2]
MTTLDNPPAAVRGPVGVDSFFQPRRFAFWLLIFLLANGLFSVSRELYQGSQVVPVTVLLGLLVWTLYTAIPLWFFHQQLDLFAQHPPLGFVLAFAYGSLGAIYLAGPVNTEFLSVLSKTTSPEFSDDWGAAIVGPTTEETLKILGVILLVLIARTQFRTLLAAASIGALVGLGFQISEDLSYTLSQGLSYPSPNEITPVLQIVLVRGILSGLWSHALFTSIAAIGVGYFLTRRHKPFGVRLAVAVGFFLIAWSMHFLWNSPLLEPENIFQIFLRGLPLFVLGALLWWLAGRDEATNLIAIADAYIDGDDLITAEERHALGSLRSRRKLRRQARKQHGRKAGRLYHELQRKQLHLVMQYGQTGPGPKADQDKLEVRLLRDRYETAVAKTPGKAEVESPS